MRRSSRLCVVPTLACLCLAISNAGADSLFSKTVADQGTLISEKKIRFREGDIITVLVRETIDASTRANTNTKKESDVESNAAAAANSFLVGQGRNGLNILNPGELPNWAIEAENEQKTTGITRRKSDLTMTLTATVMRVLPSGNLIIEGRKTVQVNRENSTLYVMGEIRARDVTAENRILSNQIANSIIELKGEGPLWNNQRRGLVTRFLDWFSPF